MRVTVLPIVVGMFVTVTQSLGKKTEGNLMKNRDHLHYNILKIRLNTKKSPGDLRRLAVTQAQEKEQYLKLV